MVVTTKSVGVLDSYQSLGVIIFVVSYLNQYLQFGHDTTLIRCVLKRRTTYKKNHSIWSRIDVGVVALDLEGEEGLLDLALDFNQFSLIRRCRDWRRMPVT